MAKDAFQSLSDRLARTSKEECERLEIAPVDETRLDDVLAGAIDPQRLIHGLAEAWRASADDVKAVLAAHGFGGILAKLPAQTEAATSGEIESPPLAAKVTFRCADDRLAIRAFNPALNEAVRAPQPALDAVSASLTAFLDKAPSDPLAALYRTDPLHYANRWLADTAPRIDAYVRDRFGSEGPRYLLNCGIGANEQFNHFVAALANARADRKVTWLMANSPRDLSDLPADATVDNTLFMEFSRSGITEETVKCHELTPPRAARVVFANAGSLEALGKRDDNLVLALPSEVSGRYGRNKTPILMAPMHVAGLDVAGYWAEIDAACREWRLEESASLPVILARYIRIQQLRRGVNHIYLGTNDARLRFSADEFCQFWNEGVNRDGNDITMSRYLGLPRDSHMNLEAMLGTSRRKMAVFLVRTCDLPQHPLASAPIEPIRAEHRGLSAGDVDLILTLANVKRCSEKMPTLVVAVNRVDLTTSAWLGQLWADLTLVYARLIGVDPGSNPEVKAVRTRAAQWLADKSAALSLLKAGD